MRNKILKLVLMTAILCLTIGLATTGFALTLSDVSGTIYADGTMTVTGTVDATGQVTIKVVDTAVADTTAQIKYIDQITVSSTGRFTTSSFKLMGALAPAKVYKLVVGGDGVSSPAVAATFKPRQVVQGTTSWVSDGPKTVVKGSNGYKFYAKALDSNGTNIISNASVTWAITGWNGDNSPTIVNNTANPVVINVPEGAAENGTFTITPTSTTDGSPAGTGVVVKVVVADNALMDYSGVSFTTAGDVVASKTLVRNSYNSFIMKDAIAQSTETTFTVPTPNNGTGATKTVAVRKIGNTSDETATSTTADSGTYSFANAGIYKAELKAVKNTDTIIRNVFFVVNNVDNRPITLAVSGTGNRTLTATATDSTESTKYKFWILKNGMTSTDNWISLGVWSTTDNTTIDSTTYPAGNYDFSVYVDLDGDGKVDAVKVIKNKTLS